MGLTLSQFATRAAALFANVKDARLLLVGLDNAGKTTLLYKFKHGEAVQTIPTIGFNTEEVQYKNIRFNMWDVGGQERIRALWQHYYVGAEACIYMVDSTDHDRFEEARDQLHAMLTDDRLRRISLLLLANKQDLPRAASVSKIAEEMRLTRLPYTIKWHIAATNAVTGEGIYEGLDWLSQNLPKKAE